MFELSETVQPVSVSVPRFSTPPALRMTLVSEPSAMVRPETVAVTPLATERTSTALLPLIVTTLAPGPSITSRTERFGQLQCAGQGDRLRGVEDRRVELDLAAGGIRVGVGLGDAVEQVARVGARAVPVSLVRSTMYIVGEPERRTRPSSPSRIQRWWPRRTCELPRAARDAISKPRIRWRNMSGLSYRYGRSLC